MAKWRVLPRSSLAPGVPFRSDGRRGRTFRFGPPRRVRTPCGSERKRFKPDLRRAVNRGPAPAAATDGNRDIPGTAPARVAVPLWLSLASLDMTCWGVGQVVVKRATDRVGAGTMVLLASLLDGAGYFVLFLAFGGPFAASAATYAFAALSGITGMAGYILYYEALLRGNVSVIATITAASPIVTILGAMAFLEEIPTLLQGIGMALLVASVLILSYEPFGQAWKIPVAVVLSVAILLLWGVWGLFTKVAVEDPGLGPWNLLLFYTAANLAMGPPYYAWRRARGPRPDSSPRAIGLGALGLGTLFTGIVALTFALSVGPASLTTAVSGSAPVVTAIVAFAFLKERPTPRRIGALALFLPGIVLVAF